MAASSVSLSSVSANAVSSGASKTRHPVALCIVGVSARPFSAAESLVLTKRRPLEFASRTSDWAAVPSIVARSYGGYGADAVDQEGWAPPPPNLSDVGPEPEEGKEETSFNEFKVPVPDERDFGFREEPEPETKLYVGNLAWSVDSSSLAEAFKNVGITELEEVNVMYDRMLGKSRGFAFVRLSTKEAADAAIEKLNGYELEGRPLRVNYPQVPRGDGFGGMRPSIPANPAKCFVANIPWSVDDQGLQEFFSSQGTVVDCRILTDAETGRSRGIGFVTFSTPDEANQAISTLDGADMGGRSIRVALATGRQ